MLNQRSIDTVAKARFGSHFLRPLYDSYCFSNIPQTILNLFSGKNEGGLPLDTIGKTDGPFERVVVFLIDGFGWELFQRHKDRYPFLKRFVDQGIVNKITSQFPSTTVPHMTCIHTGLPVGQTGLYEWFYYEPLADAPIAPLLFSYAKDKKRDTLTKSGIKPDQIFPSKTLYQALKEDNVSSYVFQSRETAHSPFSQTVLNGAQIIPYMALESGLKKLSKLFRTNEDPKSYFFFYFSGIDSKGHHFGPYAKEMDQEIDRCFTALEKLFWEQKKTSSKKTAYILMADHGFSPTDPEKTVYLNQLFPDFDRYIKKNKSQEPIVPCGSCRDMFLHIQEDKLDEVKQLLKTALKGKAEVFTTEELISLGMFGNKDKINKQFYKRVGNLVAIALDDYSVWWYEKGSFENPYYGYHGGLLPSEMETIFLFLDSCP